MWLAFVACTVFLLDGVEVRAGTQEVQVLALLFPAS